MKYVSLITLFILTFLGTWQVYRLQSKKVIEMKLESPYLEGFNINNVDEYTKVRLSSFFLKEGIYYRYAGEKGYYLLIVAKIQDDKFILVNIGTISKKNYVEVEGLRIIEGVLLPPGKKPLMIKHYDEKSDTWFAPDIKEMGRLAGVKLEPKIIWAEKADIKGIEDNGNFTVYNHHMEYIITWYSLALILGAFMIYQYLIKR